MVGRNLRFGLIAGACCLTLGLLVPPASAQVGGEPGSPFELAFWQAVSASNDPVLYEAYLKQYPSGTFASIAQIKAESLRKPAASIVAPIATMPAAAPEPAPAASPPFGSGSPALALPNLPLFGSGFDLTTPEAVSALQDAAAAQRTADAAQAAAAPSAVAASAGQILADSHVVTALVAPPALTPPPTFAFVPGGPAQDLFGSSAAMPVGSPELLASLQPNPLPTAGTVLAAAEGHVPAPGPLMAPPAPTAPPALPASLSPDLLRSAGLALAAAEAPAPGPGAPVAPPAPAAPPAMLAALGAATGLLPSAGALAAAVAAQSTPAPVRFTSAEPGKAAPAAAIVNVGPAAPPSYNEGRQLQPNYTAAQGRPQYAAAMAPRSRVRRADMPAQFQRAVVSTAAVSVEMPDASSQISPLGIMLGQLVRSQETPGTQLGFQEEVSMPMRPRLIAVPEVAVPEGFCSIEQRSAFNEGIYQPALAIAQHNAQAAKAYIRKLRTLYDNYQVAGDRISLASVAAEVRDFVQAANVANSIHDTLVNQFEDIMTIPVGSCGAIQ